MIPKPLPASIPAAQMQEEQAVQKALDQLPYGRQDPRAQQVEAQARQAFHQNSQG
jgi:hypothetical protein